MRILIYVIGALFMAAGFMDGPNGIPLAIGVVLLVLGWKFDAIFMSVSSKNATNQLIKLAELRDKGIINSAEYEERAKVLKTKI